MAEKKTKAQEEKKETSSTKTKSSAKRLAVIRIRGVTGIRKDISDTMDMLRIPNKHNCVVVDETPSIKGMIRKSKDFITWGEIDEKTYSLLKEKRGVKDADGNLKPMFRLSPPVGGFERKGIKKPFSVGGVLGDRKEKINELLVKMI